VIAATKAVEAGNRDMPGIRFRDAGGDDDPVRLGKTSAAWNKGTTATINVWESGTAGGETQTSGVTLTGCVNKFANVATGKWVIVARGVNGSYYLIAAECS
jgi:flavin-dependent dehydrogenase